MKTKHQIVGMSAVCFAALSLFSSCTVSEPDFGGSSDKARLEAITSSSMTVIDIKYDAQNRPVLIQDRMNDVKLTIEYNPLCIIEEDAGYHYDYNTDVTTIYTNCRLIMSNISLNSNGYMTSCDTEETYYSFEGEVESYETGHVNLHYDVFNHLTEYIEDGEISIKFSWSNSGLLTDIVSDEGNVRLEYGLTPTVNNQWSPYWDNLGIYRLTGLFGIAPTMMVKEVIVDEGDYYENRRKFAYQITSGGWIKAMQVAENDYVETFNFRYSSK